MSETERRYRYAYNRVLIEAQRILNPQFDDAVVFLSGAQIELLRNASQYLNRLTTYVAEYNPGYYLTPTVEDFDSILEIVADLEETLMGNPNTIWGYFDRWYQLVEGTSIGGGETVLTTTAVPVGYTYVLERWNVYHHGEQTCAVILGVNPNAVSPMLYYAPAVPHADFVMDTVRLTLGAGDTVSLRVVALPDEKDAFLKVSGYKMKVPE